MLLVSFALVSGATGGIGSAICRRLARDGFHIIAAYRSRRDVADVLVDGIRREGGEAVCVQSDLSTVDGVRELADEVIQIIETTEGARLHAVVNNAGKLLGPAFFDATEDEFDEYFATNVRAPFFLSQKLVPFVSRGASIVNISSAGAHFSSPGDIVYAMTKAALESFTRNMAEAVADRQVRVNTVIPGFTDNGHSAFRIPEVQEYMGRFAVLGGVSDPDVVADAVSFLVSDQASRTTGSSLDVSGGSTLAVRQHGASTVRALLPPES